MHIESEFYFEDLKNFYSFHVEKGSRVLEVGALAASVLHACEATLAVAAALRMLIAPHVA